MRIFKVINYLTGLFCLGKNDVILTSYPKSGNTWVRFFLCNVISLSEWDNREVTFEVLNDTMPEIGVDNLCEKWKHNTLPRFVKTHKHFYPYIHGKCPSVLLLRDPRDVMISFYEYKKGKKGDNVSQKFHDFITRDDLGIEAWCKHYISWRDKADVKMRYEDMKTDDIGEFTRMLDLLGINIEGAIIREAARRSRFGQVKKLEKKHGTGRKGSDFKENHGFARKGAVGEWEKRFGDEELEYYHSMLDNYSIDIYRQ